ATATPTPETIVQARASDIETSSSTGFDGAGRFVDFSHAKVRVLRATNAAAMGAPTPMICQASFPMLVSFPVKRGPLATLRQGRRVPSQSTLTQDAARRVQRHSGKAGPATRQGGSSDVVVRWRGRPRQAHLILSGDVLAGAAG